MAFDFRFTARAEADLDEIVSYIAVNLANPDAAAVFLDKAQAVIDEARQFPESGALVDNDYLSETNIRKKLIGHYILYYQADFARQSVVVLRILYGGRSAEAFFSMNDFTGRE